MGKIVVATQNGGLEDQVSRVFGRCPTYTIVNTENGKIKNSKVVQNQYANAMSGAGIQAAGFVTNEGAEAVISGNFGPNVASVLNQSGVKMVSASGLSAREAVEKYLDKELEPISEATSAAKTGMGQGGGRGMGMGRRMTNQQSPQTSASKVQDSKGTQNQQEVSNKKEQESQEELKSLEKRIEGLENQLNQVMKSLEDLKDR